METEQGRMLEKIRRLFELAKSSNEHESAAAVAKAQELLHKYNLSQHDIPTDEKAPFIKVNWTLKNKQPWATTLLNVLAKSNGGFVVVESKKLSQVCVIGQKHALDIIEYSYQQMDKRIGWLADVSWDIYEGELSDEKDYKISFALGIISRLKERLNKQVETQRTESAESTALVVQHGRELDLFVKQIYSRLVYSKGYSASTDGYRMGQSAGKHLHVHAGVTGGAAGMRRLS